ncbi:hypothetical protein R6Q59_031593 [Mikania micrantha]
MQGGSDLRMTVHKHNRATRECRATYDCARPKLSSVDLCTTMRELCTVVMAGDGLFGAKIPSAQFARRIPKPLHTCTVSLLKTLIVVDQFMNTIVVSRNKIHIFNHDEEMKKGIHPQMQWISYVTQSGRLMHVMMTKIHQAGKVYHFRAKRQMAESVGQVAKFKRRYGQVEEEKENEAK